MPVRAQLPLATVRYVLAAMKSISGDCGWRSITDKGKRLFSQAAHRSPRAPSLRPICVVAFPAAEDEDHHQCGSRSCLLRAPARLDGACQLRSKRIAHGFRHAQSKARRGSVPMPVSDLWQRMTGTPPMSFTRLVKAHRAAFTSI